MCKPCVAAVSDGESGISATVSVFVSARQLWATFSKLTSSQVGGDPFSIRLGFLGLFRQLFPHVQLTSSRKLSSFSASSSSSV